MHRAYSADIIQKTETEVDFVEICVIFLKFQMFQILLIIFIHRSHFDVFVFQKDISPKTMNIIALMHHLETYHVYNVADHKNLL